MIVPETSNPTVVVPLVMPLELATVLAQKTQWCFSDRMYAQLIDLLTDEQIIKLQELKVSPRPIVLPEIALEVER